VKTKIGECEQTAREELEKQTDTITANLKNNNEKALNLLKTELKKDVELLQQWIMDQKSKIMHAPSSNSALNIGMSHVTTAVTYNKGNISANNNMNLPLPYQQQSNGVGTKMTTNFPSKVILSDDDHMSLKSDNHYNMPLQSEVKIKADHEHKQQDFLVVTAGSGSSQTADQVEISQDNKGVNSVQHEEIVQIVSPAVTNNELQSQNGLGENLSNGLHTSGQGGANEEYVFDAEHDNNGDTNQMTTNSNILEGQTAGDDGNGGTGLMENFSNAFGNNSYEAAGDDGNRVAELMENFSNAFGNANLDEGLDDDDENYEENDVDSNHGTVTNNKDGYTNSDDVQAPSQSTDVNDGELHSSWDVGSDTENKFAGFQGGDIADPNDCYKGSGTGDNTMVSQFKLQDTEFNSIANDDLPDTKVNDDTITSTSLNQTDTKSTEQPKPVNSVETSNQPVLQFENSGSLVPANDQMPNPFEPSAQSSMSLPTMPHPEQAVLPTTVGGSARALENEFVQLMSKHLAANGKSNQKLMNKIEVFKKRIKRWSIQVCDKIYCKRR
jgi:hypothetical protein